MAFSKSELLNSIDESSLLFLVLFFLFLILILIFTFNSSKLTTSANSNEMMEVFKPGVYKDITENNN